MQQITANEIIGNFEAAYDDDQRAADLRSQANEISKDVKARLKEFADEIEADKREVAEAYRRYKQLRQGGDPGGDDYYTLITAVDEYFAEDEE